MPTKLSTQRETTEAKRPRTRYPGRCKHDFDPPVFRPLLRRPLAFSGSASPRPSAEMRAGSPIAGARIAAAACARAAES